MSLTRTVNSRSLGAVVIVSLAALAASPANIAAQETARQSDRQSAVTATASSGADAKQSSAGESRNTPVDAISALSATTPPDSTKRWQAGEVRFGEQWTTPDQVARLLATDPDQAAYRQRREKLAETADGHFTLAQWCRERGLLDLQRAHLLVATQLDPTDQRSHRALGLVAHNGAWMSESEITASRRREAEALQAINAWRTKLIALRRELSSTDPDVRQAAESQLLAIRDPLAIPALEEIISQVSERNGMLVLEVLGHKVHKAATRSLERHAVWHPSPRVREAAVGQLLQLDPVHYVGDLIHLLRPSSHGESWTMLPNGAPANVWFIQDFDRNYLNISVIDPTRRLGIRRFELERDRSQRVKQSLIGSVDTTNRFRMENAHAALKSTTGEDFGTDQQAWINWWQGLNYVSPGEYSNPYRTTTVRYERKGVLDPTMASCFVAGTPVWTRRGLVHIDHVQLGVLVLAKNIETGELGYQPVIDRTIRRQKPTLNFQFDGETIGVTPGHAIWSAQQGWTRARDFQPSDQVGACGGTVELLGSSEGQADFVYNLVVAGSNTYFVGRNKILVHDITPVADTVIAQSLSGEPGK